MATPSKTIEIINKYNFAFQKKFGQNFLIDTHVLDKIIAAANITKEDTILEIGPGIGSMTQYLCEKAGQVISIEIDKMLIPILEDNLKDYDNFTLINADFLKLDINKLIEEHNCKNLKVVANLPYYITTPIIMSLFENNIPLDSITVMVQKEVALRMQASPSTKDYGALSLAIQYYSTTEIVANVPPNCFMPRPNVGSAVIKLSLRPDSPYEVKDSKFMFKLVRAAFNQRRKTLVNSLVNSPNLDITKDDVLNALENMNLSPTIRGEALSLEQFCELSNLL
ncbi:MAG: 16S rRNA (adenine(1518)-N(6)/adenine(1519)-N(6))-dimethyltransferase RsmA [Lachnospiraceae bacterium]|nr:16S rRNA (adenine(1518)-N(6)/adenine(1519)-N(6))-dimethyltransferase RsmA [Lachnospiraceae bacterium]